MINVDAAVAWLVLIILFGTLFGIIWWTRDAPPYDDGVGGQWADYLPEPLEDEGWAEPPARTKPPWERDEPATTPGGGDGAVAADAAGAVDTSETSGSSADAGERVDQEGA